MTERTNFIIHESFNNEDQKTYNINAIKFLFNLVKIKNKNINYRSTDDETKEEFKNYLYNLHYKICEYKDSKIITSRLKFEQLRGKSKQYHHKYIIVRDPETGGRFNFGVYQTYNNLVNLQFQDVYEEGESRCGDEQYKFFTINDDNQYPIDDNMDFHNLNDGLQCNLKGFLVSFLWKYINNIAFFLYEPKNEKGKLEIKNQKDIRTFTEYNKYIKDDNKFKMIKTKGEDGKIYKKYENYKVISKTYNDLTQAVFVNKIIYSNNDGIFRLSDKFNDEDEILIIGPYMSNIIIKTDLKFYTLQYNYGRKKTFDKMNCRVFVHRMFGAKVYNALIKAGTPRKQYLENTASRLYNSQTNQLGINRQNKQSSLRRRNKKLSMIL